MSQADSGPVGSEPEQSLGPARRGTLVDEAYSAIRAAIARGRLKPGTKLVVRPLAEQLQLSSTPIKAALIALEREGFISAVPNRGFFVTEITEADMKEIYEIREVLEGIAAAKAAVREDRQRLAEELSFLAEAQFRSVDAHDIVAYSDLDLEFHRLIWRSADNKRLVSAAENLVGQVRFGSGTSSRLPGRLPVALNEHVAIIAAIKGGDPIVAADASRQHVKLAGEAFAFYYANAKPAT